MSGCVCVVGESNHSDLPERLSFSYCARLTDRSAQQIDIYLPYPTIRENLINLLTAA